MKSLCKTYVKHLGTLALFFTLLFSLFVSFYSSVFAEDIRGNQNKIFGLFRDDFFLYSGVTIIVSFIIVFLWQRLVNRQKAKRLIPLDYSDVPRDQRIFFELLSDTILQMRLRVGDTALDIAKHLDGLTIDEKTGRILSITENPSKIIALLVSRYEKVLGQRVSFFFRKSRS